MADITSRDKTGEIIIIGLEKNANDSLVHAVEHFVADEMPTDLKYAILHIYHAVELFLKAWLVKICPIHR